MKSPQKKSDHVTLLFFKDNLAARTFVIPLKWFSGTGLLLSLIVLSLIFTTLALTNLSWKYWNIKNAYLIELEKEIDLTEQMTELLSSDEQAPAAPETKLTPTERVATLTQPQTHAQIFGSDVSLQISEAALRPISLESPKLDWDDHILKVHFNLIHSPQLEGYQQGRILIIARSKGLFQVYPQNALNFGSIGSQSSLFSVERGEYFSVSRFREVNATFGPFESNAKVSIEVLIFNRSQELLLRQELKSTHPTRTSSLSDPQTPSVNESDHT